MKRLAIFVDGSENDRESLRSAVLFAGLSGAFLDVMHSWPIEEASPPRPAEGSPVTAEKIKGSGRGEAWNAFNDVCGGIDKASWVRVQGRMDDAVRALGLGYDALIIERVSEEIGPSATVLNTALFEAGAPVLIAPAMPPQTVGRNAAVVWTGTSQSSRALRSAMPLLHHFQHVHVLTNSANELADPAKVLDYLAAHDIEASHLAFDGAMFTARGRGRAILEAARRIDCDLLVTGAFGSNGLNAIFGLGRTTRKLVTAAPMPLFLQC